jgi:hypothetical protein
MSMAMPPMPREFRPEAALTYAQAIARPRRVGTAAEAEVRRVLTNQLERLGYSVSAESFVFSTTVNVVILLALAASLLLIGTAIGVHAFADWAPAIPVAVLLALFANFNRWLHAAEVSALTPHSLGFRLGKAYSGQNLHASLPGASTDPDTPHILLVAHYDSKSQRLPILARLALSVAYIGGITVFAVVTLISLLFPGVWAINEIVAGITLLAGLPLLAMDWADGSPGAVDNASGVGLVLHLADWLAARPDLARRLRWTILLTTAEELALMGSAAFARRHLRELRRQAAHGGLYILNIDGIGVDGTLYLDTREQTQTSRLTRWIEQAAQGQAIDLWRFNLVGVLFDHMPFARRGLDAATLTAIGPATWTVHTPRDTVEQLDVRGFEQAARVAMKVIELIALSDSPQRDAETT